MPNWDLALGLERADPAVPLYRRIALVLRGDVAAGRLRPGDRLPSSRALAAELRVNRNTVAAAVDALRREGWIEARPRSGLFVADPLPARPGARRATAPAPAFPLPPEGPGQVPARRGAHMRLLLGGVPDMRLVPTRALARAYAEALRGARGRRALDHGDPQGSERLRGALAGMLARTRGVVADPDEIAVVRGSQQALYLVARACLRPGEHVAVEDPGFPAAREVLRLAGLVAVPIPVDGGGLDVGALRAACHRHPLRAVLVTPHHQYPTTVTLAPARRAALLALAAEHRLLVVEDDYDFEFHYDGPPVLPLAATDRFASVVYVGTMSKTLAPGLRLGYLAGHAEVVRRVSRYRSWVDQQGDLVLEHAVARMIEDGEVQRHARRVRRIYQARRDTLVAALRTHLPGLAFAVPTGGMAVWARAPGVDTAAWARRALAVDLVFQPGGPMTCAGAVDDHLRLGFAACDETELVDAVARLKATAG